MNFQEYDSVKTMAYDEYCSYLQNKYGLSSCDYTFGSSGKDKRSNDGLELHHIREDIVPALSNRTVAESNPIEYQQPQNLCYCDYLEHMLLHVLIFEEDMENNYNDNVVGIMGVINHMVVRLNDFYCGDIVGYKDYEITAYHKIKDDVDVYLEIIKRIFDATPRNIHSTICNKLCMSKNNSDECQELRNNLYNDITEMISIVQEHNKEYAKKIDETIANSNKCLFILGTSMGKTTTGLDYIIKHGIRGLVVHHQNNIKDVWNKNNDLVDTISIQTLCRDYSSYDFSKYGLIIFDEAHHLSAPEWGKPIQFCIDNNIPVLGLTATPKKEVEELFGKDNVVYGYDVFEGIEKGILHPVSYVGALYTLPDKIKHAKEHPEELTPILKGKLDIALNNTPTVAEILYKNMPSGNRKGIIFAQDISDMNDAIDIVKNVFPYYDYKIISSHETEEHNKNVKEWFEKTDRGFLCSVDMVSEGSHFNGVNTLIMLRKTKSRIKFEQQLGRVMVQTKYQDPNCIVFDLVNNALTTELFTEKLRKAIEGRGDVTVIHTGDDVIKDPNKKYIIVEDYTKPLVELNKKLNGFWTEEEVQILKDFYLRNSTVGKRLKVSVLQQLIPDKSKSQILNQCAYLGLSVNKKHHWTLDEDSVLRETYPIGGAKEVHQQLPHLSYSSINQRAKTLGIKYNRFFSDEEIYILNTYYPIEGKDVLKRLPGRSLSSVQGYCSEHGITYRKKITDEVISIISEYYPLIGSKCSDMLLKRCGVNYSQQQVVALARHLKIRYCGKKSRKSKQEIINFIVDNYEILGGCGCAKQLGLSLGTIHTYTSKIRKMGIRLNSPKRTSLPKNSKKILCVETGKAYDSLNQAKRETGITSICYALQDCEKRTAGGYHWEYVEDESQNTDNTKE